MLHDLLERGDNSLRSTLSSQITQISREVLNKQVSCIQLLTEVLNKQVSCPTTEDAAEGRRFGRFMVTRVCKIKIHIRRELSRIVLAAKKIV